jgi:haloalkane dehalogenase
MVSKTKVVAPRSQWLNTVEFPFEPRGFQSEDGIMHYVDVGQGKPIVFLHGSPTWSFLYRKLIPTLSSKFRCIAVDHLGFGLSDKPRKADYSPAGHSKRLEALLNQLHLKDVTIVGHDFGGSIALDWASRNPSQVRDLVLMNTWVWSLDKIPNIRFVSHAASSPMNQYWLRLINPSPKFYFPVLFADNHRLSKWVQDQYQHAFNNQFETYGPEALAKAMTSPKGWFDAVSKRADVLQDKPCLILWGDQDITYGTDALHRLQTLLPNAATVKLPNVGNYVPEEVPDLCVRHISAFLS